MAPRFSKAFPRFEDWRVAQSAESEYVARIVRGHAVRPGATLSQLRRHPRAEQPRVSAVPKEPLSRLPLAQLTTRERAKQKLSLEVLSEYRRGKGSLSGLARRKGIAPKTVLRTTGAFRKQGYRWIATGSDSIERYLQTFEGGVRKTVLVRGSRTASVLSRYSNAVQHYRQTADPSRLEKFAGKTYRDAMGKVHSFETDPAKLRAAFEASESDFGAFGDLYAEPEEADDSA